MAPHIFVGVFENRGGIAERELPLHNFINHEKL